MHRITSCRRHNYPVPDRSGDGVLFSIDFFVSLLARLRENGRIDLHEIFTEGAEWPWDGVVQFWVNSEKPRDAAIRNTGTEFVVLSHHSYWLSDSETVDLCNRRSLLTLPCSYTSRGSNSLHCESKNPSWDFLTFSPNCWKFLVRGLQICIHLSATLTKLCHIKRDHRHMLKMSTIGWNARWVVALNIAHTFVTVGDNWIKNCNLA